MDANRYWSKAEKDFRYDNKEYQCRAVAFLAERLISCYIICNMNAVGVKALDTKTNYYN
jgi:hypothetical protein